ncbi:filamentous hemagglutinin [Arcobacter sp. F155]|uniref:two-partner secretion domain-containing protein n=1 Tax=Arcobacter sp. F155 TaxID=2044512 RepID=UPI00100A4E94|nr:filamentous hemagglutinin N-terminal domain-containing protein [Arcobacter sp. F155]RXJ77556.1 filamentous hemagglutinin [Arcobacter sp. F155]
MKRLCDFSSRFRILKGGKISLVVSALLGTTTLSFAAPSGGVVTSGSANISSSGNTTNIIQNTNKVTINWDKFNIAKDEIVNFKQPNVNSIALNRVIGNEKSIINGALNANGQVWILNSNGVLFGKNAKINTAGLLATTKNLSDNDFNSGNYNFKGNSTESVINLGEIDISDSGYATLLANTVSNEGTIKAVKGSVRLIGANEVSINLNGNSIVDLTVNKGVLDSLVENKGAIYADSGEIYLTTNAVDELLKGVVNNEGIIEANSLDGVTGFVELFAHGGQAKIGGTIRAKEGFVETSGKDFTFNDAKIEAGEWLIDPVDITIDQALADAIEIQLNNGNVTIETDANNTPDTTNNENTDGGGDIFVTGNIEYTGTNDSSLTLKAYRNIIFGDSFTPTTKGSISSTSAALDVTLWARAGGNNEATDGRVGSVWLPQGSSISTNGGDVIIGGGQDALNGYALGSYTSSSENYSLFRGAIINGDISANGGDISIRGKGGTSDSISSARGVSIAGNSRVETSGNGNISIYGIAKGGSDAVAIGDGHFGDGIEGRGIVSAQDGDIYIEGLKGSGTNSEALYMSNKSDLNSQNGNIIINASETGSIKVNLHSSLHAKTLFIFDANNVYLNDFEMGYGHIIENIVASNIAGEFNFTNSGIFTVGSFDYNTNTYDGLVAQGDINLISEGKGSGINIDKNIYSKSGDTLINGGNQINVNTDLSWDTQSKLTLQANSVNVNAEIKNTNTTNGGVYFDVSDSSFDVNFGENGKVVINNIHQLQWMNTALNGKYELGSNIDASDTINWNNGAGWNPIAINSDGFSGFNGIFNGNNHTISNLYINTPNAKWTGLFAFVSNGTIKNLVLDNFNITGDFFTGSLIGQANPNSHIENVIAQNGSVTGVRNVGGLVGALWESDYTILNSHVKNVDVTGSYIVGGLVGGVSYSRIVNSSVQGGSVKALFEENANDASGDEVGGLVGSASDTQILNSFANTNVSGENEVGGLVGKLEFSAIRNSYASGNVSGVYGVGGLVGFVLGEINDSYTLNNVSGRSDVGGLVGDFYDGIVMNSYAKGKVIGTATEKYNIGGLIGNFVDAPKAYSSYYDKIVNKNLYDELAYGKTTAQLQNINTFKDGSKYEWSIVEDSTLEKGTPILSWQVGKDGDTKPIWLIGTKVTSKPTIDKPEVETETPNKEIDKVITTIVNKEAVKVPTAPKVTTTPNNSGKNVNVSFSVGENKQIVSKPIEGQATKRVTLSEAKQMQQEVTGETVGDVKVPLSRSSQIVLVNGGVSLPTGVEQEFYVADDEI